MNDKNLHIDQLDEKGAGFFSKGKITWEKSEADVWAELSQKIDSNPAGKKIILFPQVLKYSVAALFLLLIGFGCVVIFYQKTVESLPGQHILAELPDGSTVDLNAGSSIKYNPLKWRYERKLQFEGEAFFEVEKGKTFEVVSQNGVTQVLGTSFNIYSRDNKYRVTCLTGKVKVISENEESVTLKPHSQAEIDQGRIILRKKYKAEKAVSWKNDQFFFPGTPLNEVIDEIERQYAVTIQLQPKLNERNFTSYFPKKYNVEEVLDFVCKSMKIKFVKQSDNVYLVVEKS